MIRSALALLVVLDVSTVDFPKKKQWRSTGLQRAPAIFVLRSMVKLLLWLLLLVVCWPLALLALVLYPFVWLLLLPFRLVGIVVDGVFELLRSILLLPARVVGIRP